MPKKDEEITMKGPVGSTKGSEGATKGIEITKKIAKWR